MLRSIIEKAQRKATTWASMGKIQSIMNQGDIKQGLDEMYKEIDRCSQQFNVRIYPPYLLIPRSSYDIPMTIWISIPSKPTLFSQSYLGRTVADIPHPDYQ